MLGWIIGSRMGQLIGLLLMAGIALGGWTAWNRKDAVEDAISEIERINDELAKSAIDARDGQRRCVAAGGLWDFGSARCKENRPADSGD